MFIILLKFSENKEAAKDHMQGHVDWLNKGFDDGVFQLSGSLKTQGGGGIIAIASSREELEVRIGQDPFVEKNVVKPEIIEINATKSIDQLAFLKDA